MNIHYDSESLGFFVGELEKKGSFGSKDPPTNGEAKSIPPSMN